jgi:dimethylamine/trimethylamine dehydrogenase
VQIYPDSRLSAEQILDYGFRHVCIATGSTWRRNGVGRSNFRPFVGWQHDTVYTPDDVFLGRVKAKRVVVYDDDHFYLGSAIAETLAQQGCEVIYATTADLVAPMCQLTLDQPRIHRRLLSLSVGIETSVSLTSFDGATVSMNGNITGRETHISCNALVVVTSREPNVRLYEALDQHDIQQVAGIAALSKIGDCDAPGLIAHAIYAGHEFSRELDGKKLPRRDGRLTEAISPIGNLSSSESRKMNDGTI